MFVQFALLSLSLIAVFLSQCEREPLRRWACIFGLLSQPFWFVATFEAGQWGMFALAFCYTLAWLRGFYHHWFTLPIAMTKPYEPPSNLSFDGAGKVKVNVGDILKSPEFRSTVNAVSVISRRDES